MGGGVDYCCLSAVICSIYMLCGQFLSFSRLQKTSLRLFVYYAYLLTPFSAREKKMVTSPFNWSGYG